MRKSFPLFSILTVFIFLGNSFLFGEKVVFEDHRLESEIRKIVDRPEGAIYVSDVSDIKELDLRELGIQKLNGLEHFSALEHLNIRDNYVQDVSPLSELSNLYRLNLRNNAILDLNDINLASLKDLPALRELSLRQNRGRDEEDHLRLSDLSLLEDFEQLEWMSLRDNHIHDISVFARLPELRNLNLRENFISDLSPLSDHNKLQGPGSRLYLEDNPLFDYSPIYHYVHLIETVDFDYLLQVDIPDPDLEQAVCNKLTALYGEFFSTPIFWSDLKEIRALDVRDLAVRNLEGLQFASNLEEFNIRDNGLTDKLFNDLNLPLLVDLEHLWYLNIRGNKLSYLGETSPIRYLTRLEFLSMRDNNIKDISALASLVNLKNLNARNNRITDLTPLGNLQNLLERLYLSGNDELSDFSPIAHYYELIETTDFVIPPDEPSGPVYINEVMASNGSTIADEDGDYEDWIELYNTGDTAYELGGYYISDDETNITRWQFPDGTTIPPQGFLLVRASGKDRTDASSELHTNFSVSSDGEPIILTAPDGTTIIDYMPSVPMERDQSYGRYPDATGEWYYYGDPTPGEPNPPPQAQPMEPPVYSVPGGWYEEPFSLELHAREGTIRYTLDGSEPDENSPVYTSPLLIENLTHQSNDLSTIPTNDISPDHDSYNERWREPIGNVFKGMVVRARVFQTGSLPSETVTHSYFVDEQKASRYSFPTISITTHQDNFFDNDTGIYVPGYHDNYFQRGEDWERPAHLEFFEKDGTTAVSQGVGVRIHGGTSRNRPLKSLRVYSRAKYDQPWFEYRLFPGKEIDEYKRFILRNSGNDWNQSFFRDAFMQSLLTGLDLDIQYHRPSIVFINGEYWGIHNIRDRFDQFYLETHYGIDNDEFIMLERSGGTVFYDRGNPDGEQHFHDMTDYIDQHGVSSSEHFEAVSRMMDIDNFIDYQVAQIFTMNTDWPGNNNVFWRYVTDEYDPDAPTGKDGRWRWMVFDLDFGFGLDFDYVPGRNEFAAHNTLAFATESSGPHWPNPPASTFLLRHLLENEDFRRAFINRFADLLNSRFKSSHVQSVIQEFRQQLEPEMLEHHRRWYGTENLSGWYDEIERMKDFAAQRPDYQRSHIIDHFQLPGTTDVHVEVAGPSQGTIQLNTLDLTDKMDADGKWTGTYFQDVPLSVQAAAFPGYTFKGWEGYEEAGKELEIIPSGSELTLRANFEPDIHHLSDGPYVLNYWSSEEPAGSYPPAMVFEQSSRVDPDLEPPLIHYYQQPYNNESRTRMAGLHSDGFAFINTGGTDHWHEGTQGRDLGAATLSLNTQGTEEIYLGFRAGTVIPNSRVYGLQVQYRIGNEGPFTTLEDGGKPVNYIRNEEAGHNSYLGPFSLPPELAEQELIQLRWRYHHISGTDGPRSMLRLNDIIVTGEAPHYPEDLVINEILWENESLVHPLYLDEDGSGKPFVELYNRGEEPIFLGGYHLSDCPHDLTKWTFPEVTLEGKEYMRIWLSGKNRTYDRKHLHSNFMVSPGKHSLYLVHSDGSTVVDQAPSNITLQADRSAARMPDGSSNWSICEVPTPGYPNAHEILQPPSFTPEPGFYSDALTVTINNPEPEAVLHYTLDGSDPWYSSQVQQGQPGENVDIPLEEGSVMTVSAMTTHPSAIPSLSTEGYYEVEGAIEPPQFSHPDGEHFFQPADVTISCATPDARIRYTTDGSNPADSATALTSRPGEEVTIHLPVSSHTHIRAYSFLPDRGNSPGVSAEYHVSRNIDGIFDDWSEEELREESTGHNPWSEAHNLAGLWVAWDQAFLYIGMTGRVHNQNRLSTYLCLDGSTGVTDLNDSRYSHQGNALHITAAGFGVDYAFETDGSSHGVWQYNAPDDLFDNITSAGRAAWHQNGLMNSGYEAAIPWEELFDDIPDGQIIPENLTIRLISILQNNSTSQYYTSDDIIPASNRNNGDYSSGTWHAVPDYLEINVDTDGDGIPDTPPVIRFILDMEDFDSGHIQVRGSTPFLGWDENAPVMEHISDNLYQWSHSMCRLDNQSFEYQFTSTIEDTVYRSPAEDNLQHQIIPGEDNIIKWTWDNDQVPRKTAAPRFSLPGDVYENPQDMYLSTSTTGGVIHYTTDGSDPRTSADVISGMPGETVHIHLPAGSDTLIKAYAVSEGREDSKVVSAHYIIGDQEVYFPDPGLEAAVREALSLLYGPIYSRDILPLTKLDAEERDIEHLAGIEQLINLEELILRNNSIRDLHLLETMENLTVLDLRGNQISDISPLSSLTNLVNLNLRDNQIACIEPLETLDDMVTLRLHTNIISDIDVLQNLTRIEYLSIRNNRITDIRVLAHLTELRDLNLRDNLVTDISPLEELPNLHDRLYLSGNPGLHDFSPVAQYYHQIAEVDFEIETIVEGWLLFR